MKKLMGFGIIGLSREKPIWDLSLRDPPWYCIFSCFKYFPVSWGNMKQTFSIHYHWFCLYRYWVFEHFLDQLQSVLPMMPLLRFRFLEWLSKTIFVLFLPCFVPSMTASFLIVPMNTVLEKGVNFAVGKGGWWRMLGTECVGDKFEMLVTDCNEKKINKTKQLWSCDHNLKSANCWLSTS